MIPSMYPPRLPFTPMADSNPSNAGVMPTPQMIVISNTAVDTPSQFTLGPSVNFRESPTLSGVIVTL